MLRGRRKSGTATPAWTELQARFTWPEQERYEEIRPVVLFERPITERAQEVGVSPRTLSRTLQQFVQFGLPGLVPATARREDDGRLLPPAIREQVLLLKAEHPPLSASELASICTIQFNRTIDYRTIQGVLARYPLPAVTGRRYPRYHECPDHEARREAMLRLHVEGWSVKAISSYLQVARRTVHAFLRRWAEEGIAGLPDKSRARKQLRKVTLPVAAAVK
jgi:transposase